jgi:hypothetical protein
MRDQGRGRILRSDKNRDKENMQDLLVGNVPYRERQAG